MENNKDIYFAPIVIPTLCRSKHFIRLMESLKRNTWAKFTDVYVGLDYPPAEKYREGWKKICEYLENDDFNQYFAKFTVFKHEKNLGSCANTLHLIHYVWDRYECWIRTDDDAEFSPNFLEYEDKCLWEYRNDPKVICVSGYSYPIKWKVQDGATCLKQNFCVSSWGLGFWRTKKDGYSSYISSGKMLNDAAKVIKNGYDKRMIDSCFRDYFSAALSYGSQVPLMKICSDVSLRAYLACKSCYCIFPVLSKVRNHGFDGSGEYCTAVEKNGSHALDYNYSEQEIDMSTDFTLVTDDSLQFMDENRAALNEFDYRSPEEMELAQRNFALIKKYGMTLAKLIHGVESFFKNKIG